MHLVAPLAFSTTELSLGWLSFPCICRASTFGPSCSFPPPSPSPPPQIDNEGGRRRRSSEAHGGGQILFIEFAEWAIKKNLLEKVHDDDE
jgi:hypothetical protein